MPISNERLLAIAGRVARELFTSGGTNSEEAERLVLLASDGRDLGGWVFGPVAEKILEAEVAKEAREGGLEFRALLDWLMCSDPWPTNSEHQETIVAMLNVKAKELGFSNWIDAYHRYDPAEAEGGNDDNR